MQQVKKKTWKMIREWFEGLSGEIFEHEHTKEKSTLRSGRRTELEIDIFKIKSNKNTDYTVKLRRDVYRGLYYIGFKKNE